MKPLEIGLGQAFKTIADLQMRLTNAAIEIAQLQEQNDALQERVNELAPKEAKDG